MKLFGIVLVIYVVALTLFGVDGRGGGGTSKGAEESQVMPLFKRVRRHAPDVLVNELNQGQVANEPPPPPPEQFRRRRQAPPGLPPPPEVPGGVPAPPAGIPGAINPY